MPEKETKHQRFKRLATQRTNSILDRIRVLGNCANRNDYDYTEEDISKIFSVIDREIRKVKGKFNQNPKRNYKFSL